MSLGNANTDASLLEFLSRLLEIEAGRQMFFLFWWLVFKLLCIPFLKNSVRLPKFSFMSGILTKLKEEFYQVSASAVPHSLSRSFFDVRLGGTNYSFKIRECVQAFQWRNTKIGK